MGGQLRSADVPPQLCWEFPNLVVSNLSVLQFVCGGALLGSFAPFLCSPLLETGNRTGTELEPKTVGTVPKGPKVKQDYVLFKREGIAEEKEENDQKKLAKKVLGK